MIGFYPAWLETLAPEARETLALDAGSLDPGALTLETLVREISLRRRPAWILRMLMSALETGRMERKLGWSRPWNKQGMTIFRSHAVRAASDVALLGHARSVLETVRPGLPETYAAFVRDLLADPGLMAFLFYHNRVAVEGEYEGFTLSFGRRCREDRSKRDRLDFVLEDLRVGGAVDGVPDRFRLYVNPWDRYREGDCHVSDARLEEGGGLLLQGLYREGVACYRDWKDDPRRQWTHWSVRYIDYFGARSFIPRGTSFA